MHERPVPQTAQLPAPRMPLHAPSWRRRCCFLSWPAPCAAWRGCPLRPPSLRLRSLVNKGPETSSSSNQAFQVLMATLLQLFLGAVLIYVAEACANHIPHLHRCQGALRAKFMAGIGVYRIIMPGIPLPRRPASARWTRLLSHPQASAEQPLVNFVHGRHQEVAYSTRMHISNLPASLLFPPPALWRADRCD